MLSMFRILAIALLFMPLAAHADEDHDDHHEERRSLNAAIERGEILPLSEILAQTKDRIEGRVVEIEFEHDDGRPIYEIYVLRNDGRRLEYEIDARTGKILSLEDDD
ncbi:PepSY domain-containing protein [Hoeflea sp.]|uniref:PepSY domain-containing protein n=1 Tax=Hoeflea sp. TaxID=1940281 RepID=UPI003B525E4F